MAEKPLVFRRSASGLVRTMDAYDVFVYNVPWSMMPLTTGAYFYLQGPYAFPGASLWLSALILTIWATPHFLAYSMLASTMPRSGGDYIFQSRILHPIVGTSTMMAMALILIQWIVMSAYWTMGMGLGPMLTTLGVMLRNPALVSWGVWCSSPWGIFWGTFIQNFIVFLIYMPGLWFGAKTGRYASVFSWMGMGLLAVLVFLFGRAQFIQQYNSFMSYLDPAVPNYYNYVIEVARAGGHPLVRPFSWYDTLGAMTLAWMVLAWPIWVYMVLGEVKGAESLKRMTTLTLGSLWFCGIIMIVWAIGLVQMIGQEFLAAAGYCYYTGAIAFPLLPFFQPLVAIVSPHPIIPVLIFAGCIAIGVWQAWVCYCGASRIWLAMSLDRSLPEWFGRLDKRFRHLFNAGLFMLITTQIYGYIFNLVPGIYVYTAACALIACIFQWCTALAATVFPFVPRMREIYRASPASRYKIGPVPLITLCGIAGMAMNALLLYYSLAVNELFLNYPPSLAVLVGFLVACALIWPVSYWYWKRKGIDISLAFREVPPL